jgi:hypothetical protein
MQPGVHSAWWEQSGATEAAYTRFGTASRQIKMEAALAARPMHRHRRATPFPSFFQLLAFAAVVGTAWTFRFDVKDYALRTLSGLTGSGRSEVNVAGKVRPTAGVFAADDQQSFNREQLTELLQTLKHAEWLSATYQDLLAHERGLNQELEKKLNAQSRNDPDNGPPVPVLATANQPQESAADDHMGSTAQAKAAANDVPAASREPSVAAPLLLAPAQASAEHTSPTASPAPHNLSAQEGRVAAEAISKDRPQRLSGEPGARRLVDRARQLIDRGDISGARAVLERAAGMGSARALFILAQTFDPAVLSSWGAIGTEPNKERAQQLYTEAFAGGVQEAADRLEKQP